MSKKEETAGKKRFPWGKFFAWKTSDVSFSAMYIIITSYLTIYCTNFLGLRGAVVGTILLVSNILDFVTDLVAGFIIDNTHSKLGKGRPYELGIVGMWICTFLLFSGPTGASQTVKVLWVFFMYTFIFGVFNTLRGAGSTAYMLRAFDNDRVLVGKVSSYGGFVSTIGGMIVSVTFPLAMGALATSAAGWRTLVGIYALPLAIIGLGRFVFVKENPKIDAGAQHVKVTLKDIWAVFTKNKWVWVYAGMILIYNTLMQMNVQTYYFTYVVGSLDMLSIMGVCSIVIMPLLLLIPVLLKKFPVTKIIGYGLCASILGYVLNYFAGANMGMLFAAALLNAMGTLPIAYLCALLLMDLFDYNEHLGLARLEGTTNQIAHGLSSQLGEGIGGFLLGIFLDIGGFVAAENGAAVQQPESAIGMIRNLYSIIPLVLVLAIIAFAFMLGKFEKQMPAIREELELKRQRISEEAAAEAE